MQRDGPLRVWEPPEKGAEYVIGADPAEGIGQDRSAAVVVKRRPPGTAEPLRVVAVYHSAAVPPDLFGVELVKLGKWYAAGGDMLPHLVIERNNHGITTIDTIKGEYWNLYAEERYDELLQRETARLGWHTNTRTKDLVLDVLMALCRDGELEIPDRRVLREMSTMARDDRGRANARRRHHDDLVMALAIAVTVERHMVPVMPPQPKREDFDPRSLGWVDRPRVERGGAVQEALGGVV